VASLGGWRQGRRVVDTPPAVWDEALANQRGRGDAPGARRWRDVRVGCRAAHVEGCSRRRARARARVSQRAAARHTRAHPLPADWRTRVDQRGRRRRMGGIPRVARGAASWRDAHP
jgi:hypothetical protein